MLSVCCPQVRDQAMGLDSEDLPQSDVGKEFQLTNLAKEGILDSAFGDSRPNDTLLRLQVSRRCCYFCCFVCFVFVALFVFSVFD